MKEVLLKLYVYVGLGGSFYRKSTIIKRYYSNRNLDICFTCTLCIHVLMPGRLHVKSYKLQDGGSVKFKRVKITSVRIKQA